MPKKEFKHQYEQLYGAVIRNEVIRYVKDKLEPTADSCTASV